MCSDKNGKAPGIPSKIMKQPQTSQELDGVRQSPQSKAGGTPMYAPVPPPPVRVVVSYRDWRRSVTVFCRAGCLYSCRERPNSGHRTWWGSGQSSCRCTSTTVTYTVIVIQWLSSTVTVIQSLILKLPVTAVTRRMSTYYCSKPTTFQEKMIF